MDRTLIEDGNNLYIRMDAEADPGGLYELRMISHNQPKELVPMHVSGEKGHTVFDYNITGLASLRDCEGKDSAEYLYSVIFALERLGETLEEHLLSADRVILDTDMIFLRKETGAVCFCYFPGKSGSFQDSVQSLMEYFLKIIEPLNEEEVLLLYGLYQKTRENNVRPRTLADFWRENRGREKLPEEDRSTIAEARAANAGLPVPRTGKAEAAIYRDLGLEPETTNRPFLKWKARQEEAENIYSLEERKENDMREPENTRAAEAARPSKLNRFFRNNVFELAATAVVMAGLVMYFSR